MSLAKKIKTGLDETRILILGSQILLGFGLQTAFRPVFQDLPARDRLAEVAAITLITLTVGLIIAPSAQHRIVEGGRDTKRLLDEIRRCATWALAPFALALGLDVFLAAERIVGVRASAAMGAAFCALAGLFWYALEWVKERRETSDLRAREEDEPDWEHTPLDKKIEQMLTEMRVVLPGAQALLGFQLIIVFSDAFETLPGGAKAAHLAALGCVALAVIWLMAPAAFHRIVYDGEDTPRVSPDRHRVSACGEFHAGARHRRRSRGRGRQGAHVLDGGRRRGIAVLRPADRPVARLPCRAETQGRAPARPEWVTIAGSNSSPGQRLDNDLSHPRRTMR